MGKQQKHVLQSKYSTQYDPFEFFEEAVNHKEKFEELNAVWLSDDMQWVMSIELDSSAIYLVRLNTRLAQPRQFHIPNSFIAVVESILIR